MAAKTVILSFLSFSLFLQPCLSYSPRKIFPGSVSYAMLGDQAAIDEGDRLLQSMVNNVIDPNERVRAEREAHEITSSIIGSALLKSTVENSVDKFKERTSRSLEKTEEMIDRVYQNTMANMDAINDNNKGISQILDILKDLSSTVKYQNSIMAKVIDELNVLRDSAKRTTTPIPSILPNPAVQHRPAPFVPAFQQVPRSNINPPSHPVSSQPGMSAVYRVKIGAVDSQVEGAGYMKHEGFSLTSGIGHNSVLGSNQKTVIHQSPADQAYAVASSYSNTI